jgi:hypothetical protein
MSLKHRVKKLEQKNSIGDNPVTKIIVRYIDMEGKVSGTAIKKLIDGVWCEKVKVIKLEESK